MTDLVLAFDTETTGLPLWHEPSDHKDQPHVVSLAMELCSPDGDVIDTYDKIVNIGVPIPAETIAIHGITDEMARGGIEPGQMLADFEAWVARAGVMTGYNVTFDQRMMRIQAARHLGRKWESPIPYFDTCFAAKDACKIPGKRKGTLKKPNLTEAMAIIFGEEHTGAHNALADTIAARRLYFNLRHTMAPMLPKSQREDAALVESAARTVGDILDDMPINDRVVEGSNNPPAETPFEALKREIDDYYAEAKTWLDGQPIETQGQAEEVGKIRDNLRTLKRKADEQRKVEAKPFDDGKKEVQDRYNPLIKDGTGIADRAIKACNDALAPYLKKIDDDQRAEAKRLADVAAAAAQEALSAARAAADSGNLDHREKAEDLLSQAKDVFSTMKHAEKAKPQVMGASRAIGMKTVYIPELVDPAAAIEHYRKVQPAALKEWMLEQAAKDVRAGPKPPAAIPGFTIREDRVPA